MSHQVQEHHNLAHSYLFLLGMSIISGLLIFTIRMIPYDCYEMMCMYPYLIELCGQWLLIIPATIVIVSIFRWLVHSNYLGNVHRIVLIGIPLIFNILGAVSFIFMITIRDQTNAQQERISIDNFSRNLVLTLKEDSVQDSSSKVYSAYYKALLHVKNNTGKVIKTGNEEMVFTIGAFDVGESGWGPNNFGAEWVEGILPIGDSEIQINIPLDVQCADGNLEKPLSIKYSVPGSEFNSIPVRNNINKELQQVVCDSTK